ncbi:hypothetical protein [Burkholderia sp. 22PA0106]|uniref:hypothetical protein n=1 Tax=Burkholderia sp. 22PA0106 TaxID=3237371 RepID=UPI0039C1A405
MKEQAQPQGKQIAPWLAISYFYLSSSNALQKSIPDLHPYMIMPAGKTIKATRSTSFRDSTGSPGGGFRAIRDAKHRTKTYRRLGRFPIMRHPK